MNRKRSRILWTLALVPILSAAVCAAAPAETFTSDFRLERCTWSSQGAQNAFFPLVPGRVLELEGEEKDGGATSVVRVRITVLDETKRIVFVTPRGKRIELLARVVEEREWVDEELVEVSRNWFARCVPTGDIYYFGEFVTNFEDGEPVDHAGSWIAGKAGAQPGLIMPGTFLLGARYFQELAPGVALDRGENVAMGVAWPTPLGTLPGCVQVLDTNALDPNAPGDLKTYCPGVGLAGDETLVLVDR